MTKVVRIGENVPALSKRVTLQFTSEDVFATKVNVSTQAAKNSAVGAVIRVALLRRLGHSPK